MVGIEVVDDGQCIPLHTMLLKQTDATHHLAPRRCARTRTPVLIVELLRTVNGDADKEVVLFQELAPFVGQPHAVSLQAVVYLPSMRIAPLQLQGPFVERDGTHQRLTAMPCEQYLRQCLRLNILADELLQQLVADDLRLVQRVQLLLLQIVAVLASQVAEAPRWLEHHI